MSEVMTVAKKKRPAVQHEKKMVSFKLSANARDMVEVLSGEMGVDKTAIIELAVRNLYEKEFLLKVPKNQK